MFVYVSLLVCVNFSFVHDKIVVFLKFEVFDRVIVVKNKMNASMSVRF